jgi:hypothetical protein
MTLEKTCPRAALATTDLTRLDLGHCGRKPELQNTCIRRFLNGAVYLSVVENKS